MAKATASTMRSYPGRSAEESCWAASAVRPATLGRFGREPSARTSSPTTRRRFAHARLRRVPSLSWTCMTPITVPANSPCATRRATSGRSVPTAANRESPDLALRWVVGHGRVEPAAPSGPSAIRVLFAGPRALLSDHTNVATAMTSTRWCFPSVLAPIWRPAHGRKSRPGARPRRAASSHAAARIMPDPETAGSPTSSLA